MKVLGNAEHCNFVSDITMTDASII